MKIKIIQLLLVLVLFGCQKNDIDVFNGSNTNLSKLNGNSTKIVKNIKVPMLYITGEKDLNSTPSMSKKLAKINNQNYAIIKGARHVVPVTHSKQCNFHLINFIKGLQ